MALFWKCQCVQKLWTDVITWCCSPVWGIPACTKILDKFDYMMVFTCYGNASIYKHFGQYWMHCVVHLFWDCQYEQKLWTCLIRRCSSPVWGMPVWTKTLDRFDSMALFTCVGNASMYKHFRQTFWTNLITWWCSLLGGMPVGTKTLDRFGYMMLFACLENASMH